MEVLPKGAAISGHLGAVHGLPLSPDRGGEQKNEPLQKHHEGSRSSSSEEPAFSSALGDATEPAPGDFACSSSNSPSVYVPPSLESFVSREGAFPAVI